MIPRPLIHVTGTDPAITHRFVRSLIAAAKFLPTHVHAIRTETSSRSSRAVSSRKKIRRLPRRDNDPHRYEFSDPDVFAFYDSPFMEEFSECILIEGDRPVDEIDLSVFVATPLPPGESLLTLSDPPVAEPQTLDLEGLFAGLRPGSDLTFGLIARELGLTGGASPKSKGGFENAFHEQLRNMVRGEQMRRRDRKKGEKVWSVHPGYRGIERATVVVVHFETEDDRPRALALLEQVNRIRKDITIFQDVCSFGVRRTAITAVVAHASDPKDPGTKKAIARIARCVANVRDS